MTHENISGPTIHRLSNRTFGLAFGTSMAVLGVFPLVRHHPVRFWALGLSIFFYLSGIIYPKMLGPLNAVWSRITGLLTSLLIHLNGALLLWVFFAPANLVCRMMGRDALRLRRDPSATSYWINRTPPGPAPETMINQF